MNSEKPNLGMALKSLRTATKLSLAPNLDEHTSAENSPATSVLGSRCHKPSESLGDERNVLPSLAELYERRALVPCWAIFEKPKNPTRVAPSQGLSRSVKVGQGRSGSVKVGQAWSKYAFHGKRWQSQ